MFQNKLLRFCFLFIGILLIPVASYAQFFNLGALWKRVLVEPDNPGVWSTRVHIPEPTTRAEAVWTGTEMIIFGGFIESYQTTGNGYSYNPTSDTWSLLPTENAPSARGRHTATWTGTEVVIWGGISYEATSFSALGDGAKYNPSTQTWTTISSTSAPVARFNHTAVWTGTDYIIYWGGQLDGSTSTNTGAIYNATTNAWVQATTTSSAPSARYGQVAAWVGTEMLVWGGSVANGSTYLYDPIADDWSSKFPTTDTPTSRAHASYISTGSEVIMFGGMDTNGDPVGDGSVYSFAPGTWKKTSITNAPTARHGSSAVWDDTDNMILFGGYDGTNYLNEGYKYSLSGDSWTSISSTNAPSLRTNSAVVWTGDEMVIWGGSNGDTYLNDGGKYDSASDIWTPITISNPAPFIGGYATAIWTGSEVLFFGGANATASAQGYRYNYTTDTWSAMSTTNAYAKIYHTAVWTGTEMLVWGGMNGSAANSLAGAIYNPTADTWTQMTQTAAPTARRRHVAVWTGTQMIVWGGWDDTNVLSDGKRYNWPGNTWSTMTTSNAPTKVMYHRAVWDGTEMYVMGGMDQNYIVPLWHLSSRDSVKSYNPASNTWTTRASLATGRYYHAAVWTGSKILVWGGTLGSGSSSPGYNYSYLSSGEVYDPGTDSWTAMPDSGLSGRTTIPSLWTGSELVVWGGADETDMLNDGARYNPVKNKWTTMATEGRPSSRAQYPAAVISDSKILITGGNGYSAKPFYGSIHLYSILTYCPQKLTSGSCEAIAGCDWSGGTCANDCSEPSTQFDCEKIDSCEWSGGTCQAI